MKRTGLTRWLIMIAMAGALLTGLVACNSNETLLSQKSPGQTTAGQTTATPALPPPDNARRITADELHKLWEKNQVVVIDTRPEPAYKQEHIKGSLSMPTGTLLQHIDELPKDKLIAAYCT